MPARTYFVTATGTDIGKTYVTAGIIRAARAAGRPISAIKPLLSGYTPETAATSDAAILLAAMGRRVTHRNIAAITPWRFTAPLSPDLAAAREGRTLNLPALAAFLTARKIPIAAIVLSESPNGPIPLAETAQTLAQHLPHPIHTIPRTFNNRSFDTLAAAL